MHYTNLKLPEEHQSLEASFVFTKSLESESKILYSRYYLYAAKEDSSKIIFFYKSFYQTLLGYWKLGDDSPLVISHGAAAHILTRKCAHSQLLGKWRTHKNGIKGWQDSSVV